MEDNTPTGTPAPEAPAVEQAPDQTLEATEATEADGQTETQEETKAEIKRLKKLQLKVDGEEYEEELPFEIDEDKADWMKKHLQMSKAAQKRMQEAKTL